MKPLARVSFPTLFRSFCYHYNTFVGKNTYSKDIELVITDMQMPDMDGLQASMRIREIEKSRGTYTPILALTAHTMKGDRERCLAAGASDYMSKPLDVEKLLSLVRVWMPR